MTGGARAAAVRPAAGDATLYAEDLPVGTVVALDSRQVREDEMVAFASDWDPQAMHVDPDAARVGPFGGVIASGVHTIALFHRLHVDGLLGRAAVIAGRGMEELRLPAPIRAGDVLTGSVEVVGWRARPDRHDAVVTTRGTMVNQDGVLVFVMVGDVLIASRTAASPTDVALDRSVNER